jgi:cytochrome c-type biogenesis protein CcmE
MSPKQRQRLTMALIGIFGIGGAVGLVLYALSQNINLFYTPTDIANGQVEMEEYFRLGGMVIKGSVVRKKELNVSFKLTDYQNEMDVEYKGILPDLFREGQGIVAMGQLKNRNCFTATEVLAKHDENYMPPEVAAGIKRAEKSLIQ